ncbi:sterol desaturase family protein [Sphingomonas astaxanthinifaciens]|uniref:Fatty acid hydroxylase domain-containing protein n=1 Tax=Sphingomonas astaxanthinifaciens DSM 22298 TaxID=1123267 RepID=A0ABQ5Z780_9SPHN|nr:sterol desaturase family protein [Sphingomonas astaxanthinifaciens]GLR48655.1 hypothetical protein GCM10007925_23740 [Sphingomonas astaxanthinifaciens DSM 22298]
MALIVEQLRGIPGVIFSTGYLILLCTIAEMVSQQEPFRWRVRWPGVMFGLMVPVFAVVVSTPLNWLWGHLGIGPLIRLPTQQVGSVGAVLAMLLVTDFLMYWEHRFEHRFLWPVHAVHHSVEHLSAATSISHPLQFVPMFLFVAIPLSLIDFGSYAMPSMVVIVTSFLLLFIHSPVRTGFGPLRHLLVEPAFHRIHHSLEERHFDRNFSILFSFWDRLFGTCVMPRPGEWPKTGIHEAPSPRSLAELLAFPFRLWRREQPPAPIVDSTALQPAVPDANRQAA